MDCRSRPRSCPTPARGGIDLHGEDVSLLGEASHAAECRIDSSYTGKDADFMARSIFARSVGLRREQALLFLHRVFWP